MNKNDYESALAYTKKRWGTEQDVTPATEALVDAFKDEELCKNSLVFLKKLWDGEPVNENPIKEIPTSEKRLYYIDGTYFENLGEALECCDCRNIKQEKIDILDYYREFAGRSDVIRCQTNGSVMIITAVDDDGYGIYNSERSIYRGEFIWEYNYGSMKDVYNAFRDNGVVFENDIYAEYDKRTEHILSYCRTNNLFNMGKK